MDRAIGERRCYVSLGRRYSPISMALVPAGLV